MFKKTMIGLGVFYALAGSAYAALDLDSVIKQLPQRSLVVVWERLIDEQAAEVGKEGALAIAQYSMYGGTGVESGSQQEWRIIAGNVPEGTAACNAGDDGVCPVLQTVAEGNDGVMMLDLHSATIFNEIENLWGDGGWIGAKLVACVTPNDGVNIGERSCRVGTTSLDLYSDPVGNKPDAAIDSLTTADGTFTTNSVIDVTFTYIAPEDEVVIGDGTTIQFKNQAGGIIHTQTKAEGMGPGTGPNQWIASYDLATLDGAALANAAIEGHPLTVCVIPKTDAPLPQSGDAVCQDTPQEIGVPGGDSAPTLTQEDMTYHNMQGSIVQQLQVGKTYYVDDVRGYSDGDDDLQDILKTHGSVTWKKNVEPAVEVGDGYYYTPTVDDVLTGVKACATPAPRTGNTAADEACGAVIPVIE